MLHRVEQSTQRESDLRVKRAIFTREPAVFSCEGETAGFCFSRRESFSEPEQQVAAVRAGGIPAHPAGFGLKGIFRQRAQSGPDW